MRRTVAVTGIGVITSLGRCADSSWRAIERGEIGIAELHDEGRPAWMSWAGSAGVVEPPRGLDRSVQSQWKFLNRGGQLGFSAAWDAVGQASIPGSISPDRLALFLATGDLTSADCSRLRPATHAASDGSWRELDAARLNRTAAAAVYPFFLLETLANNPFSLICAALGITGSSATLASHSPAGAQALDLAFRSVRHGRADAAVAVGCGSWLRPLPMLEMDGLGILSRCRAGARSYRPFDRRRDGFIVGEGAAALVLEPEDQARARAAPVLARVESSWSTTEAVAGLGVPERVTARTLARALEEAGSETGELGFVCAHGSGTRKGDASELRSLAEGLGEHGRGLPICALKPYTGHMGAASDIAEVIFGISAAGRRVVPATPNFASPADGFAHLHIANQPQPCRSPRFLSASYGVGGQSSAVVVTVP